HRRFPSFPTRRSSDLLACLERGIAVDLLFQSIAGTQAANASFGVSLGLLREGRDRVLEQHHQRNVAWAGDQVMYFETGQGSALRSEEHTSELQSPDHL